MNESSGVERPLLGVSLPSKDPGRFVCISPRSVLWSMGVSDAIGGICEWFRYLSENVKSNEMLEAALDMLDSL